jgi:hypothetical protein
MANDQPNTSSFALRVSRGGWYLLLVLTLSLYLLRQVYDGPYGKDFTIFLTGARVITSGQGANLYDLDVQAKTQLLVVGPEAFKGGLLPFNYPPYVAALILPLTLVPPGAAYYIWVAVQWLVLVALALSISAHFRREALITPRPVLFMLFSFAPLIEALLMGQMSVILLALWWWIFLAWRNGRWGTLGVGLALAAFKPQMAILLIAGLAAQKRWRALIYAGAVQAALWAVALLLLGPGVLGGYLRMLQVSAQTTGTLGFYPAAMPNLRGLLTTLGVPSGLSLQLALLCWLLSVGACALVWRLPWSVPTRFGVTVILAVLLSPHLYIHDATLLALAPICARLAYSERGLELDMKWVFIPCAALFLGMYSVVLQLAGGYWAVILAVWFFGLVMLAFLLRIGSKEAAALHFGSGLLNPKPKLDKGELWRKAAK